MEIDGKMAQEYLLFFENAAPAGSRNKAKKFLRQMCDFISYEAEKRSERERVWGSGGVEGNGEEVGVGWGIGRGKVVGEGRGRGEKG